MSLVLLVQRAGAWLSFCSIYTLPWNCARSKHRVPGFLSRFLCLCFQFYIESATADSLSLRVLAISNSRYYLLQFATIVNIYWASD
ncbi:unnamed protein product [Periconia digitata]|uniref:Uncharacterized protein n=1 Tax=Periconia digitata TaxID=1303443 RepID=A0A9W4UV63_9PLEO|nr:unnamed protein product [Periconia digitata]